jgi:hypothetical protein
MIAETTTQDYHHIEYALHDMVVLGLLYHTIYVVGAISPHSIHTLHLPINP